MEYAVELLKERLEQLDISYLDFVINGDVKEDSDVAKKNRTKATDCEKAIKRLTEPKTTKANLNIADVIKSEAKAMTLKQFYDQNNYDLDGYYAVWRSGMIPIGDNFAHGFSGGIAKYTDQSGFEDYPDWMEDADDNEIKILLLEELPTIDELRGY